jgi:hypothetical protein
LNFAHKYLKLNEIGWRENVGLPELGLSTLRAKIDTGARTSALHATGIDTFERDGRKFVSFNASGDKRSVILRCTFPIADQRGIKNTSGVQEQRIVINTILVLGSRHWHVELSLADRENMGFELILGRTAIRTHNLLVNPGRSFLAGPPKQLAQKHKNSAPSSIEATMDLKT